MFQTYKSDDPRIDCLQSATWIELPEVAKDGLGLLKGIKADVQLESEVKPKFVKANQYYLS